MENKWRTKPDEIPVQKRINDTDPLAPGEGVGKQRAIARN